MRKSIILVIIILSIFNCFYYYTKADSTDNQNWKCFVYDKQAWGLGPVNRLAITGNKLFASGYFSQRFYDSTKFNCIAELQDTLWMPLGNGEYAGIRAGYITTVNDMVIKDSNLYVVGNFDTAGTISAKNIAKWNINSRTWSSVGKGTNGIISTIIKLNDKLVIGGNFDTLYTSNDTIIAHNIAEWDGDEWVNLGNGLNGPVNSLYANGNYLYAVGEFDTVGTIYSRNVGIWNDSINQWTGFGSYGPTGEVFAVCKQGNVLYLGGYFDSVNTSSGQIEAKNLVSWDGTSWTQVGNGINGFIHRLKSNDSNIFVTGSFEKVKNDTVTCRNIVKWNGSDWEFFGSGTSQETRDLTFWGDSILVGGSFYFTGDTLAEFIGLWYDGGNPNLNKSSKGSKNEDKIRIKSYPNPAKERLEIEFYINENSKIEISVYDINGNKRDHIMAAFFDKGWHKAYWKTSKVENGSYIIEVKSNSTKTTEKVIINR